MRIRTADPLLAKQMLYQLSYAPLRINHPGLSLQMLLPKEVGEMKKLSSTLRTSPS